MSEQRANKRKIIDEPSNGVTIFFIVISPVPSPKQFYIKDLSLETTGKVQKRRLNSITINKISSNSYEEYLVKDECIFRLVVTVSTIFKR